MKFILASLIMFFTGQSRPSGDTPVQKAPAVLVDAFRHRSSFKTAVLTCRYERDWPGRTPWVRNLELRWANDVLHQTDYGDDDGFMAPRNPKTGEHRLGVYGCCTPAEHVYDRAQNVSWGHLMCSPLVGRSVFSDVRPDYVDFRTYGLRGGEIPLKSPDEFAMAFLSDASDASFSVESVGKPIVRVKQVGPKMQNGLRLETTWVIDTEKGPEILHVSESIVHPDGKREFLQEMECILAQFDGRWWPAEVNGRMANGGKTRVQFFHAEFDRAEHPAKIDPDSIGIPVGADITIQNDQGRYHYVGGGEVVDHATWEATKSKYDLSAFHAYQARARTYSTGEFPAWWSASAETYGVEGAADRPDLWEAYVRRWVIKHSTNGDWRVAESLTDQQKTAAKGILDDCRKRAVPIRARLDQERTIARTELAAVEKLLAMPVTSAPAASAAKASASSSRPSLTSQPTADESDRAKVEARVSELRAKIAALEKSPEIERLFDELKKRLQGLLTSRQADPESGRFDRPVPPQMPTSGATTQPPVPADRG